MKSVCGKYETHGLIKFILSRWYALIKIRKQSMVLFLSLFCKIHLGKKKPLCLSCGPLGGLEHG